MRVRIRGAVTYEADEALENGLKQVEDLLKNTSNPLLTMEHIEPLGLHVTVHQSTSANEAQIEYIRSVLKTLAESAYSGYIDMWLDDHESERFHAKEIGFRELTVADIADV
ncbi:MAG: hypothetical protein AAF846_04625 [Chloroflexota bacterium]